MTDECRSPLAGLFSSYDAVVVLDTETTGLRMEYDEIIELGAVRLRMEQGVLTEDLQISALIALSPGRKLPPNITQLTGITPQMLQREGISKEAAGQALAQMLSLPRTLVVAYNAQFDLNFLFHFLHRLGLSSVLQGITMLDALTVYRDRREYPHRLENAIEAYGLQSCAVNSHRAVDDARATVELLKAMERECSDLLCYRNLFGYHPKYGISGKRIRSVTYLPQPYAPHEKLYTMLPATC